MKKSLINISVKRWVMIVLLNIFMLTFTILFFSSDVVNVFQRQGSIMSFYIIYLILINNYSYSNSINNYRYKSISKVRRQLFTQMSKISIIYFTIYLGSIIVLYIAFNKIIYMNYLPFYIFVSLMNLLTINVMYSLFKSVDKENLASYVQIIILMISYCVYVLFGPSINMYNLYYYPSLLIHSIKGISLEIVLTYGIHLYILYLISHLKVKEVVR